MATIPLSQVQPLTATSNLRSGTQALPAGPNPAPWSGPSGGILDLLNQYMPNVQQQGLLGMMARGQSLYTPARGGGNVNALSQGNLYTAPNVPAFPSTTPAPGTGGTGTPPTRPLGTPPPTWTWNGTTWVPPGGWHHGGGVLPPATGGQMPWNGWGPRPGAHDLQPGMPGYVPPVA